MGREERERQPRPRAARKNKPRPYFDVTMIFSLFLLVVIGLVMIYSTTAYKSGNHDFVSQLVAVGLGVFLMLLASFFPFKKIPGVWAIALIVATVFIIALFSPLKMTINGATRWVNIAGVSVQVAEVVKFALILTMPYLLTIPIVDMREIKVELGMYIVPVFFAGILGIISRNMSSAFIIVLICTAMIFVSSYRPKVYILLAIAVAAIAVLAIVLIDTNVVSGGFRGDRVRLWLHPNDEALRARLETEIDDYQSMQAVYAIGSGGIAGKGIGEGIQKINKIPEAQNDMIYSVLCEELGFVGAFLIIALFIVLITRLFILANNAASRFDALLITGVLAQVGFQTILNIAVVTQTIPNTGVSLPFISSGGTSVMFLLMEFGLVINVSRYNKLSEKRSER